MWELTLSRYIFLCSSSARYPYRWMKAASWTGQSYPRIYFSIILPNLKPAIATVLIIKFVSMYNDFYTPQLYMQDDRLLVVSTVLYKYISSTKIQWEVVFAGIILCIIPTLVIFLFCRSTFTAVWYRVRLAL